MYVIHGRIDQNVPITRVMNKLALAAVLQRWDGAPFRRRATLLKTSRTRLKTARSGPQR